MLKPGEKPDGAGRSADREDEESGRHEEELDPRIQAGPREASVGMERARGGMSVSGGVSGYLCVCRRSWSSSTRPARRSTDWSCSWT